MRKLKSLQWISVMMLATQLNPNQPNHYFSALPVRAREHQIRARKKCIIGGPCRGSYWYRVTVYPYNGYIESTNLIVRHVKSLTCTMKWTRANQHAPKHAAIQPLHRSHVSSRAPNLVTSKGAKVVAPTGIVLPSIHTTDTLKVQILSCDMSSH